MTSYRTLFCTVSFLIILNCTKAFTQIKDIEFEENRLAKLYSKLSNFIGADYDSISSYSDLFEKDFTVFIRNNPATLNYPFKQLIDGNFCQIKTSEDGNFRIYSWDTWTGGTMHISRKLYQWKADGKVFMKVPNYKEDDAGSFCSKIFTVNIKKRPYYLAVTNGVFSTKDVMQSISAFSIENSGLIDTVQLFKTKTEKLNTITVEFDFFSVVDRPERPLELIKYDEKRKRIYIPVVDEEGQVTRKNILYQLKDRYFEFIGIVTGSVSQDPDTTINQLAGVSEEVSFIAKIDLRQATKDGIYLNGFVVNLPYEKTRALDGKTVRITGKVTIVKGNKSYADGEIKQNREVDTKHILKPQIEMVN